MIDWKGELEAVHSDGRVVPVELAKGVPQPDDQGDYRLTIGLENRGHSACYFCADGTQRFALHNNTRPWKIRNRQRASSTGLTITLTGPQGCGKTQTKKWLERNLPWACNGIHYRDADGNLAVKIIDADAEDPKFATPPIDAEEALVATIRERVSELNNLLVDAAKRGIRAEVSTGQITPLIGDRRTRTRLIVDLSKVLSWGPWMGIRE